MTDQIREQMSALLDGELPARRGGPAGAAHGARRRTAARLRQLRRWPANRCARPAAVLASPGFAARVAPPSTRASALAPIATAVAARPPRHCAGGGPLAAAAVAASAALAAVLLVRPDGTSRSLRAAFGCAGRNARRDHAGRRCEPDAGRRTSASRATSWPTASTPRRSAGATPGRTHSRPTRASPASPTRTPRRVDAASGCRCSPCGLAALAAPPPRPADRTPRVAGAHDHGARDAQLRRPVHPHGRQRNPRPCASCTACDDGRSMERLVSLDGSGREIVRTPEEVHFYMPDRRVVLVEPRSDDGSLLQGAARAGPAARCGLHAAACARAPAARPRRAHAGHPAAR